MSINNLIGDLLAMLDMVKSQQMTDIIHGLIPYSGIEHAVISTPIFNRLHRVLQSSLVFLTYPSNKVKRFEHSVGVMHLAGSTFFHSICNAEELILKEFLSKVSDEIIAWRKNLDFSKYSFVSKELRNKYKDNSILQATVPASNFYNSFYPKNLPSEYVFSYYVVFQAIRLAGLLHDVGHLPYSHILEHSLKKMYLTIKRKKDISDVEAEFIQIMQRFAEGDDEIHEEIGKLLVDNIRSSIIESISDRSDPNIYYFLVSFDFAEKIICSKNSDNTIFSDLHLITASVLDSDRLDYCSRDAFCSGTDKSIFSYDRLLSTYKLKKINNEGVPRYFFCPQTKVLSSVEELLRKRKSIFEEINYHHRVHKHEILLEEVISTLGIRELESMQQVDELSNTLPLKISSIWKLIAKLKSSNDWPEYQIIQLDDSWLDTLLKHCFFDIYGADYLSLRKYGNDILWNKFDELISSTKRYHSFLKRTSDFREFDKLFFTYLKENIDSMDNFISNKIPALTTYSSFYEKYHSFIFNYCIEILCITDTHKQRFFENFELELNSLLKDEDLSINNCLLRSCMFSFGYKTAKTPLYLYNSDDTEIKIEQTSSQLEIFQQERALSPIFHLYYLPEYNTSYNAYKEISTKQFMKVLSTAAINTFINFKLT